MMATGGSDERLFIGIDPGLRGALAVITAGRDVLLVEDFPITETPKSPTYRKGKRVQGMRREFNFVALAGLFDRLAMLPGTKFALLEKVTAMPLDSAVSAFTFGGSYWALQASLANHGIGYELVGSKDWQAAELATLPKERTALRAAYLDKARKLFPDAELHLKKHAERAAALLIADFCRKNQLAEGAERT